MPTELPGSGRLYGRLESKAPFKERIRQEAKSLGERKVFFPEPLVISRKQWKPRQFDPRVCLVTPNYVVHQRLLFEQKNLERYGWDLGVLTPAANLGVFAYDMFTLPYHIWSRPLDQMDTARANTCPATMCRFCSIPNRSASRGSRAWRARIWRDRSSSANVESRGFAPHRVIDSLA